MAAESWRLVFAILEHDPETEQSVHQYSKLSERWDKFKSACKITKDTVIDSIVLNFKLVCLRDCFFDRTVDDRMVRHLTTMINTSYISIIQHIVSTPACANSLVQSLRKKYTPALGLLLEISSILKMHDSLIITARVVSSHSDS